jgi:hypothetical protein
MGRKISVFGKRIQGETDGRARSEVAPGSFSFSIASHDICVLRSPHTPRDFFEKARRL